MPPLIMDDEVPTPARLFKACRRALGLSVEGMQDELCLMDKATVLKIERGVAPVLGTTWVALWYLLDEKLGELEEAAEPSPVPDLIRQLQGYLDIYMEAIQKAAAERRAQVEGRRPPRETMDDDEDSAFNYARDPL